MDETVTHIKVHFIDWDAHWDQWIPKGELVHKKSSCGSSKDTPVDVRCSSFIEKLQIGIKNHLTFHRAHDPIVTLRLDCDKETFETIFGNLGKNKIIKNNELDKILGENWHTRIINCYGEFCTVVDETVVILLKKHRSLKEYVQCDDGSLVEQVTEKGCYVLFRFVKTEGKKCIA